jgi:hypothetical protein
MVWLGSFLTFEFDFCGKAPAGTPTLAEWEMGYRARHRQMGRMAIVPLFIRGSRL